MIACILSAALVVPTTVHAQTHVSANNVTCWGDWCSGKNPQDTHCADDATTIAEADVVTKYPDVTTNYGKLEVRWSPTCKTKWARLSLTKEMIVTYLTATQDSGYEQTWHTSGSDNTSGAGVFYTNMIYSPILRVYAHLVDADAYCDVCATNWV